MLVEMYHRKILSKLSIMASTESEKAGKQYGEDFLSAVSSLKLIVNVGNSNVVLYEEFQTALADAFDSHYRDPFQLVSEYVKDLTQNMKLWVRRPTDYNTPYTNVVNASMMGKSRLLKEIAIRIPTVYICLREQNDGYPIASPKDIIDIFVSPSYRPDLSAKTTRITLFVDF